MAQKIIMEKLPLILQVKKDIFQLFNILLEKVLILKKKIMNKELHF